MYDIIDIRLFRVAVELNLKSPICVLAVDRKDGCGIVNVRVAFEGILEKVFESVCIRVGIVPPVSCVAGCTKMGFPSALQSGELDCRDGECIGHLITIIG